MHKNQETFSSFVIVLLSLIMILSIVSRFSFVITVQSAVFLILTALILFILNNYKIEKRGYLISSLFLVLAASVSYINADYQVNVRNNLMALSSAVMAGFSVTFLNIDLRKKIFIVPVFIGLWLSMIVVSRFLSAPYDFFSGNVSFYEGMALNVNVIAGFLILVYPILFLLIKDGDKKISRVYAVMAFMFLLAIFITKARIAIAASLIVTLIFLFENRKKLYAKILIGFITAVLLGAIIYVSVLKYGNGDSIAERLVWWQTAWLIFQEHILFGAGMGNFSVLFKAYRPELVLNTLYAHNIFMQFLADIGIIGTSAFIYLMFVFYKHAVVGFIRSENKYFYKVILISVSSFLFVNICDYSFFVPANMLVFFIICFSVFFQETGKLKKERVNDYIVAAVFLSIVFFAGRPAVADRYYKSGIDFSVTKRYKFAVKSFENAVKYDSKNPEYYYQLANSYFALFDADRQNGGEYAQKAIMYTAKAVEFYRSSSQLKASLASMYWILGDKENALKYIKEAKKCDKFNFYIDEQMQKIQNFQ